MAYNSTAYINIKITPEQIMKAYEKAFDGIGVIKAKLDRIAERLATEVAKPIMLSEFGHALLDPDDGAVTVSVSKRGNTYSITASGKAVCFLEFGTGAYADVNHPYAKRVPFEVRPGSWSETHANTWQEWIDNGGDPKKYRYNTQPRRAMYEAYKAVKKEAPRIIREEFEE